MPESRPFVAVIDPALRVAETDCFNRMSRASPIPLTYHLPGLQQQEELPKIDAALRGVIILGSGASIHDSLPWQDRLCTFVKELGQRRVPLLGICYGHQLLVKAFGGQVDYVSEDQAKEKGERTICFSEAWLGNPSEIRCIVSHREQVSVLPPDFLTVASSAKVKVEVMRHTSKPIYGIQAHPEATPSFLANQEIVIDTNFNFSAPQKLVDDFIQLLTLRP